MEGTMSLRLGREFQRDFSDERNYTEDAIGLVVSLITAEHGIVVANQAVSNNHNVPTLYDPLVPVGPE